MIADETTWRKIKFVAAAADEGMMMMYARAETLGPTLV